MEYEDFLNQFITRFGERLKRGYKISPHVVTKNNGIIRHGILVSEEDNRLSPIVYLDESFRQVNSGELSMDEAVDMIYRQYMESRNCPRLDQKMLSDFNQLKEKIIFRLINRERNEELLRDIPYVEFLDLAVTFAILVSIRSDGDASIQIRNEHAKMWGVGEKELMDIALENTPRLLTCDVTDIPTVVQLLCGRSELDAVPQPENDMPIYVLSNKERVHGAACLLYPNVLDVAGNKIGEDFYVIPSSTHETLLFPASHAPDVSDLTDMIRCVNTEAVSEEDYLSDHPYFYSRERQELSVA